MRLLIFVGLFVALQTIADNTLGLPTLKIPDSNPQTQAKIDLGRKFFYDTSFSLDGSISCASCHIQSKAFTDGLSVAKGINGKIGTKNTPTLVNVAFFNTFFLDGHSNSLESQALEPMLNPIEHGLENKQKILDVVINNNFYTKSLQSIFNLTAQDLTVTHIASVIASFERTLIAGNSAFDRYYFARDKTQLSVSSARGLRIFRGKGNCANCHEISWNNALFSDNRFYNIGIGFDKIRDLIDELTQHLAKLGDLNQAVITNKQQSELGRFNVTQFIDDIGKFKTPTLRNIALTAPYMHDGSLQTLKQVVDYYDKGGNHNKFIDAAIFPLHLSTQEKHDLIAFMQSLTSQQFTTNSLQLVDP